MCLGLPGRIAETYEANGLRMGRIDFGGVIKEACLEYLPDARAGDYAIIHVGFAIGLLDEAAARRSLELLEAAGLLAVELGEQPGAVDS